MPFAQRGAAPVTLALVAVNILVFALMVADGGQALSVDPDVAIAWGANFAPLTAGGEPWRLVTSAAVHFGLLHVAVNCLALLDSGRICERLYGSGAFLFVYAFAALSGGAASMAWHGDRAVSAGASGAVFGAYGALLAYLLVRHQALPAAVARRLGAGAAVFIAASLALGFAYPGIDNAAHAGGLAGGFGAGALVAWPGDRWLQRCGPVLRMALLGAAGMLVSWALMPEPAYDYRKEVQFREAWTWFAAQEKSILGEVKAAAEERRAGRSGDAEMARRMSELAGRWDAAHARIAALALEPEAPSRELYELLLRYASLRRDSLLALADALRDPRPERVQRFEAQRALVEEVAEEFKRLGGEGHGHRGGHDAG